jgi:1-acyl-sn-glycerol-3-phosphate acyltransferase
MNREQIVFKLNQTSMAAYAHTLLNYDLLMEEALPAGPKIIVANHPTTTDPFLLPLLVNEPIYMLITELAFQAPILGQLLQAAGHIRVPSTHGSGEQIIAAAVERLKTGATVGLFPEGHLSPDINQFCRARSGAARVALLSGAPVIPVGISLNPNGYLTTRYAGEEARWARGSYYLTVGKPMTFVGDVDDHDLVRKVSDQILDSIALQTRKSAARMKITHIQWMPFLPLAAR